MKKKDIIYIIVKFILLVNSCAGFDTYMWPFNHHHSHHIDKKGLSSPKNSL